MFFGKVAAPVEGMQLSPTPSTNLVESTTNLALWIYVFCKGVAPIEGMTVESNTVHKNRLAFPSSDF